MGIGEGGGGGGAPSDVRYEIFFEKIIPTLLERKIEIGISSTRIEGPEPHGTRRYSARIEFLLLGKTIHSVFHPSGSTKLEKILQKYGGNLDYPFRNITSSTSQYFG